MEAIGRLYERDKEAELKDTRFYLPEENSGEAAAGSFLLPAPFTSEARRTKASGSNSGDHSSVQASAENHLSCRE